MDDIDLFSAFDDEAPDVSVVTTNKRVNTVSHSKKPKKAKVAEKEKEINENDQEKEE
eukprot:Pgem_evm1s5583